MIYRLAFFSALWSVSCLAQNTAHSVSVQDFNFGLRGGVLYQGSNAGGEVITPKFAQTETPPPPKYASNEPLFHGAAWFDASLAFQKRGFHVNANLVAEHLGQSYGVYTRSAMDVFPKYNAGIDTGLEVFGHKLAASISVGNYDDVRFQQGLTIYNIDLQGSRWALTYGALTASYQKVADLIAWMGLNINDLNIWSFKLDSLKISDDLKISAEVSNLIPVGFSSKRAIRSYSVNLGLQNGLNLYSEYGNQNNGEHSNAWVSGCSYHTKTSWFDLRSHLEYRSYQAQFNSSFYSSYRIDYHTGGPHLYPLSLFDRPFSQWAVFTEYQGLNVSCLTFFADLKVPIWQGLFASGLLDWNRITAETWGSFNYPFWRASLGWQPFDGAYVSYGFTNRTMNLDKPYTTIYLFQNPSDEFRIGWDLRF